MKIIAISASQVPSSAANSIQALKAVHALAQAGHDVRLLVPQPSQEASPTKVNLSSFYGLEKTFPVEFLPAASRRLFFWRAVQSARAQKPDVLYVWPPQSAVYGLMAGLPVLLEMHDLPSGLFGPLWYRAFLALPGKKRQAVITRSLQNLLQNRFGAAETVLAPNGVDLERFAHQPDSASARHLLNLPQTQTAACVGHLYPGRGVEMFLALAGKMQPVHFLWVGGNAEEVEMWRAKAAQMNLSNVTFTGFIHNSQIPLYQAAADVLLMPYSREIGISSGGGNSGQVSSPMKMFEYLASGRAILASDLPVFHETLNEQNAVFCPPEKVSMWYGALQALLDDPLRRAFLAKQARADAVHYTWARRADQILSGFVHA